MLKWMLLFLFVYINSFALEISLDSAKDDFTRYSTLNLRDNDKFSCQEIKNNFNVTTKIVCAFSKKPSQNIKSFQNDFLKVNSLIKGTTYFLIIKPIYKIKLFSNIFNLTKDNTTFVVLASNSKNWTIVGYKDKFPLIKQIKDESSIAINFPFYLDKTKLPYVGSLDLRGYPVHIKKVEDVKEYLRVKKLYKDKQYDVCLDTIEDILSSYPNTLFKSELLYYKIKVYDKLKDWENIIANSKVFLREYSSSDNIPEILSLIAKGYVKVSQSTDADYFFDRLFSEHSSSVYSKWGYIYKADMLLDNGANKEAKKYYMRALSETKNLKVASTAAFRLANMLIDNSIKESSLYIMKIAKANPGFFASHFKASKDIMTKYADNVDYTTAAAIAGALLNGINATFDDYEELLKDKALWLAKTENKKAALDALNDYIKKFPDGDFIEKIEDVKNELFFDVSDLNATAKLKEYDRLIKEYNDKNIGNRALYEKAKLLLKEKKYSQVLDLRDELKSLDEDHYKDVDEIIKQAAIGNMKESLKVKDCKNVLVISSLYKIKLSDMWDDGLYECAMKGGDFSLSKTIALKNLKVKNLKARQKWLYRYAKVEFATGNYSDVIDISKDLISLIKDNKNSKYKDIYRILFDAYQRVENRNGMINTISIIQNIFGLSYNDIDRYVEMINLANNMHDDNMIIQYATKVMKMQKKSNSYIQSPFVEFALYEAYIDKKSYENAYAVIKSLDERKLKTLDRARQKYLLGNVLSKLWKDEDAKKAYEESIKADKNSSWAKLAQSAIKIL